MESQEIKRPQETQPTPHASRWPDNPDFWRLWAVGAVQFGVRWLDTLAIGVFAYQTTGSAFIVTMLTMLRMLPMAIFGIFFGPAVERFDGRKILMATLGLSAVSAIFMGLLAHAGYLAIWHLAVAAFISGTVWSSDIPLRRLMIARVISNDRMANAMALDSSTSNASRMAGPAVGGFVLATWGIAGCFAVGAVLYLVAMIAASTIRYRNPVASPGSAGLFFENIQSGLRLVVGDRGLTGYFIVTIVFNVFGLPIVSLVPVIAQDHFHLGARGTGLFASMDGLGAICGAMILFLVGQRTNFAKVYVFAVIIFLSGLMTMSVMPYMLLSGFALLMSGFGSAGFGVMQSTLIFHTVKPEMRGLLLGLLTAAIGTGPIGFVQIGLLAEAVGAQKAILISGAEGLLVLYLTRSLWQRIGKVAS